VVLRLSDLGADRKGYNPLGRDAVNQGRALF